MNNEETFHLILNRFKVKRISNGTAFCICPGHTDAKPSLHISMGAKKIILDCKAGCNYKDVLVAASLKPQELYYDYYDKDKEPLQQKKERKIIDRYNYHNIETGEYTHTKYRTKDKDFYQGYYKGGRWENGIKEVNTSLSVFCNGQIDRLKSAISDGTIVCYSEGERDTKTLLKHGQIAFTCGAKGTFKEALLPFLKGGKFVVFGDNDSGGIEDAERITTLLNTIGKAASIIPPGVSEKGDISDWMQNHTKEDLENLIDETVKSMNGTVTRNRAGDFDNSENLSQKESGVEPPLVKLLLDYNRVYDKDGNEKSAKIVQSVRNHEIVLENDYRFTGRIKFNEFSCEMNLSGSVLWDAKNKIRPWQNFDDSEIFKIIQSEYGLNSRADYFDAVRNVSMRNRFHPVQEFLDSLEWDGIKRIDKLLINYLGAEDTEYTRYVIKLWMLGAVSRVYQPGTKFDYCLILTGRQGIGKSSFLRFLAMDDSWFSDSLDDLSGDRAVQSIFGVWIVELAELKSLVRTAGGMDSVKRFLSATQDRIRLPYERRSTTFLRQTVFAGTTNRSDFLTDTTGNRRFLIVPVGDSKPKKDLFSSSTKEEFKQAWAEAVHIFKTENPDLVLPERFSEEAEDLRSQNMADDGMRGLIEDFLAHKEKTCVLEIWNECLNESERPQKWKSNEISDVINSIPGWEKAKTPRKYGKYGSQRIYQKKELLTVTKPTTNQLQNQENDADGFVVLDGKELNELPFD